MRFMRVREAEDFLVQQTREQAALENIPLSDLETRMMCFTESGEMSEDPLELNSPFDSGYDTDKYEAKISKLMRHAHWRLQKENPDSARQWDVALAKLADGDHYISALWEIGSKERPPYDSLKLFLTAFLICVVLVASSFLMDHYGIHRNDGRQIHNQMPIWLQHLIQAALIGVYIFALVFLWVLRNPTGKIRQFLLRLVHRAPQDKPRT